MIRNTKRLGKIFLSVQIVNNTTVHKSTGENDFDLVFGDEAVYNIDLLFYKGPDAQLAVLDYTQMLDEERKHAQKIDTDGVVNGDKEDDASLHRN